MERCRRDAFITLRGPERLSKSSDYPTSPISLGLCVALPGGAETTAAVAWLGKKIGLTAKASDEAYRARLLQADPVRSWCGLACRWPSPDCAFRLSGVNRRGTVVAGQMQVEFAVNLPVVAVAAMKGTGEFGFTGRSYGRHDCF